MPPAFVERCTKRLDKGVSSKKNQWRWQIRSRCGRRISAELANGAVVILSWTIKLVPMPRLHELTEYQQCDQQEQFVATKPVHKAIEFLFGSKIIRDYHYRSQQLPQESPAGGVWVHVKAARNCVNSHKITIPTFLTVAGPS